jgi:alpha-ketoglutarate-dependent 2,4-dichlorophenoxyacetate dioxygenase
MSVLHIEKLHPDFGASITGVDLAEPLAAAVLQAINAAIDEYSFVCFPNQLFDDGKQLAFTQALGAAEPSHVALGQEGRIEYFGTIGSVQADGTTIGNDHQKTHFMTVNNIWQTDASFKPVSAKLSIMCAYECLEEGAESLFVSNRAAYDRLPADM